MEPTTVPETGKLTQSTRRSFIRGIATAGASTAAAVALERAGIDLFNAATADGAPGTTPFLPEPVLPARSRRRRRA